VATPVNERPAIISFRNVSKRFGTHVVLDGLCIDVRDGEKLAIIGRSGSGKSTLLRIIMTLEPIDGGDVTIDGTPLWRSTSCGSVCATATQQRIVRSSVGMVFQQFNLFPHMTALRNVAEAPVRVLRMPRMEAETRARELLALVGLADKERSFPAQLSGGQQQRVAIARALAMQPKILLFDEVTSALDPELVGEVLGVIRMLARESRCTILLVTHQMGFAKEFADRVCFLERGKVVEEGPPQQIFVAPQHESTRSFLRAILES